MTDAYTCSLIIYCAAHTGYSQSTGTVIFNDDIPQAHHTILLAFA